MKTHLVKKNGSKKLLPSPTLVEKQWQKIYNEKKKKKKEEKKENKDLQKETKEKKLLEVGSWKKKLQFFFS